ncbi:MAG: cupin domain-containing protein, partial [Sphingomonadales bacterium]|nr:cupin domain-containing protein [Sphingomonadales bacterium]
MTALSAYRRVVTGLNEAGRSCIVIDGPIPCENGFNAALAWRTAALPADNSGSDDPVAPYTLEMLHPAGSAFTICEFAPGGQGGQGGQGGMHATDTIDYLVILKGEVTLLLEAGEARLKAGDFVVDRGTVHSWRNDGGE